MVTQIALNEKIELKENVSFFLINGKFSSKVDHFYRVIIIGFEHVSHTLTYRKKNNKFSKVRSVVKSDDVTKLTKYVDNSSTRELECVECKRISLTYL